MNDSPPTTSNDPLHGITLRALLETLLAKYGWDGLADHVNVNCFSIDPSIKSSLKFLRKTPWARAKVEKLYLADIRAEEKRKRRNADRLRRRRLAEAGSAEVGSAEAGSAEAGSAEAGSAEEGGGEAPSSQTFTPDHDAEV